MWKYLATLAVLLAIGGLTGAQSNCVDCYANIVIQDDTQTIERVVLADDLQKDATVGNEGLSAGIIVTAAPTAATDVFKHAPFARIDQVQEQTITDLGSVGGAKGVTINKAIQSAWVANQGLKEKEPVNGVDTWVKEGALVSQTTTQTIDEITDYDCQSEAQVFNADNKLAMIVDDLGKVIELTGTAKTTAEDSQTSTGTINNDVNIDVDPATT
jgi:hypothetical protein